MDDLNKQLEELERQLKERAVWLQAHDPSFQNLLGKYEAWLAVREGSNGKSDNKKPREGS